MSTNGIRSAEEAVFDAFLTVAVGVQRGVDADLSFEHRRSLTDYLTLRRLSEAKDHRLGMSQLAAATHMAVSSVSRIVERLERDGLVAREPARDDRRGWQAVLTDGGFQWLQRAAPTYTASTRRHVLDQLDRENLSALAAAVHRLAGPPQPDSGAVVAEPVLEQGERVPC
jgi:DNA-binding MarR family transcriptional regulator